MDNLVTFLQRLFKRTQRCNETFVRMVVSKLTNLCGFSKAIILDAYKKCRELLVSKDVNKERNYIVNRFNSTSKQLLACIMRYKVVVKCKNGILCFIQKVNPIVWLRKGKTTITSGIALLVSIFLILVLVEGEDLELALAAETDAAASLYDEVYGEEDLLLINDLVVEETTEQTLQDLSNEFSEVILDEEQGEEEVIVETAGYKTYAKAVTESVLEETSIEKQLNVETAEFEDKDISVMDINDYNLQINYGITRDDLTLFERLVEAEAGGEDLKGKILVANVVLNRVKSSKFPDTLEGVIMERNGRTTQFSPVSDGRLWSVTVSSQTREAVKRALDGEDYSKGALYFMERSYASSSSAAWFDRALTRVTSHGCHEFFK